MPQARSSNREAFGHLKFSSLETQAWAEGKGEQFSRGLCNLASHYKIDLEGRVGARSLVEQGSFSFILQADLEKRKLYCR